MELTTFGKLILNWHIRGVDQSEEMTKISKAKLDHQKLNNRILLHNGFIESLPEIEKYDFATIIFVVRFIPEAKDRVSLLYNVAKRLKSGA